MKYFALIVLVTMLVSLLGVLVALAMWPGRAARSRGHPNADAVAVAGWVGLLAGGVLWPLALVWAYTVPARQWHPAPSSGDDNVDDAGGDLK
jgi:hypothetical protein